MFVEKIYPMIRGPVRSQIAIPIGLLTEPVLEIIVESTNMSLLAERRTTCVGMSSPARHGSTVPLTSQLHTSDLDIAIECRGKDRMRSGLAVVTSGDLNTDVLGTHLFKQRTSSE